MKHIDPKTIALKFNNCINNRNLDGLLELMTDDHLFVDRDNNHIKGKAVCSEKVWRPFFDLFPDYQNIFEKVTSKDSTVFLQGYCTCSDERLNNIRCIWVAPIENNKVKEWRIYLDIEENRNKFGI